MLQSADIELGQQLRRGGIFKMAETSRDALLERIGIVAARQHRGIVIAFQHQRIADGESFDDMRRRNADIGEHAEAHAAIAQGELRGFARIVRHRKRLDLEVADRERLMAVDDAHIQAFFAAQACHRGAVRHEERNAETPRTRRRAADVVAVLVRDEDRIEAVDARARQAARQLARAEAAIDQYRGARCLHGDGIAAAAATQRCEANQRSSPCRTMAAIVRKQEHKCGTNTGRKRAALRPIMRVGQI